MRHPEKSSSEESSPSDQFTEVLITKTLSGELTWYAWTPFPGYICEVMWRSDLPDGNFLKCIRHEVILMHPPAVVLDGRYNANTLVLYKAIVDMHVKSEEYQKAANDARNRKLDLEASRRNSLISLGIDPSQICVVHLEERVYEPSY